MFFIFFNVFFNLFLMFLFINIAGLDARVLVLRTLQLSEGIRAERTRHWSEPSSNGAESADNAPSNGQNSADKYCCDDQKYPYANQNEARNSNSSMLANKPPIFSQNNIPVPSSLIRNGKLKEESSRSRSHVSRCVSESDSSRPRTESLSPVKHSRSQGINFLRFGSVRFTKSKEAGRDEANLGRPMSEIFHRSSVRDGFADIEYVNSLHQEMVAELSLVKSRLVQLNVGHDEVINVGINKLEQICEALGRIGGTDLIPKTEDFNNSSITSERDSKQTNVKSSVNKNYSDKLSVPTAQTNSSHNGSKIVANNDSVKKVIFHPLMN